MTILEVKSLKKILKKLRNGENTLLNTLKEGLIIRLNSLNGWQLQDFCVKI